ncbi:3-hydroxyisobutyryl-CoA hydrolase, mitochondrial [Caenorhabditis elegans]|uniref:3-hydroxyisobutyryl-CoA hydrolase, mitochondrial n=2 Tax=Caenorhabditis elegans TaxID=6239 RepID=Q19278_CAEEL|nr:3-hydroxyisobutyryl-CoA hydrolase, mitochondrial [Caenorhabditis elegans]CCD68384.1 3-hydroxyisobutyryl-CoA hydrolase, mitochondrial [Caenorhabditis elegans]|eukprot:NP_741143.1 3-hydroxyisobutyryl-CoA hydrolase, mitochondrial [Caenorhabditis elegans]
MAATVRNLPALFRGLHSKEVCQKMSFSVSAAAKSEILVDTHGSKKVVTLNRPKALNALNLEMVREFYPKLQAWNSSSDVDLVILKGSGDKAFCAGGDVLAVVRSFKDSESGKECTMHKDFFREEYILNHLIGTLNKQYVCLIDGIVMGGGCGLSVNGRFRVATEKTMLAMPETALGLFPDVGGSYFLSRLKGNLGMYLALTGYRLLGADAFHAGLATHFVESSELAKLEKELVNIKDVTENSVDEVIRSFEPKKIPEFSLSKNLAQIRDSFKAKSVEEILASLEKDGSDWAKKQAATLGKMSPTSLKVTHRQITEGSKMSYAKIFTMEYRLTQRFLADKDFHEGCRAILVDKDRKPKWNPATLADVKDSVVDNYFSPLPNNSDLKL